MRVPAGAVSRHPAPRPLGAFGGPGIRSTAKRPSLGAAAQRRAAVARREARGVLVEAPPRVVDPAARTAAHHVVGAGPRRRRHGRRRDDDERAISADRLIAAPIVGFAARADGRRPRALKRMVTTLQRRILSRMILERVRSTRRPFTRTTARSPARERLETDHDSAPAAANAREPRPRADAAPAIASSARGGAPLATGGRYASTSAPSPAARNAAAAFEHRPAGPWAAAAPQQRFGLLDAEIGAVGAQRRRDPADVGRGEARALTDRRRSVGHRRDVHLASEPGQIHLRAARRERAQSRRSDQQPETARTSGDRGRHVDRAAVIASGGDHDHPVSARVADDVSQSSPVPRAADRQRGPPTASSITRTSTPESTFLPHAALDALPIRRRRHLLAAPCQRPHRQHLQPRPRPHHPPAVGGRPGHHRDVGAVARLADVVDRAAEDRLAPDEDRLRCRG